MNDAIRNLGRYAGSQSHYDGPYNGKGGYGPGYGYNPWYGNGYYNDYHDDYADAYRDAAIANAVVNVVGIIASSALAPRVVQPAGHYERRQVVVQPGYYEDTRVWVPDYRDPANGDVVTGHYEVRRRWVPEVYGHQDVWVGPPAAAVTPVSTPVPGPVAAPVVVRP